MSGLKTANWELIKNIVLDIINDYDGVVSLDNILHEFIVRHPDRNSTNVQFDTNLIAVNSQSRLSYLYIYGKPSIGKKIRNPNLKNSSSEYPRIASVDNNKDFLFALGKGKFEIYDSLRHGIWQIVLDENDVNHLIRVENTKPLVLENSLIETEIANYHREFDLEVKESLSVSSNARLVRLATSEIVPKLETIVTTVFKRNPDVVAEVLFRANGVCFDCNSRAPFNRKSDDTPYLEVHHIVPLSQGGTDSLNNAIALCPNCHRKRHFG